MREEGGVALEDTPVSLAVSSFLASVLLVLLMDVTMAETASFARRLTDGASPATNKNRNNQDRP